MAKIGVGLIGCGGRLRGVARNVLTCCDDIEVRALCDPNEDSIRAARDHLSLNGAARVCRTPQELASAADIDWVMIGSWNCFHREHVEAAFAAGRHVFCEKPLATTIDDCLAMRDAWRAAGKQFVIGFTLRYSPHYRKIKEVLDSGAIGDIVSLEFNETLHFCHGGYIHGDWRRLVQNAGTHLLEKCCHDVDLVNWVVGSPAARVASFGGTNFFKPDNAGYIEKLGKNRDGKDAYRTWPGPVNENPFTSDKDIIDNQVAIIEFANGVRSTFHTNCNAGIPERRMYICGTEGAVRADVIRGSIELQRIGFDTAIENVSTDASGGHGGGDSILARNIADCMLAKDQPFTGLEDGLRSAITCFGIDQAMDTGTVVDMQPLWEQAGIGMP